MPEHEKLCNEAVWFTQNMLLGTHGDMDQIAEAIRKIHAHAAASPRREQSTPTYFVEFHHGRHTPGERPPCQFRVSAWHASNTRIDRVCWPGVTYHPGTSRRLRHAADVTDRNGGRSLLAIMLPGLAGDDRHLHRQRGQDLKPAARRARLTNPLAIRIMNYGKYQDDAWTHLPTLGMHYVFLATPAPDQVASVEKRLADHYLRPLVLRGDTDLGRASSVDELAGQLAVVEKMGVKYMFLSPKHTGVSKQVAYERLRRAGDVAREHGVTIVLETHPDLGGTADAHRETMRQIHHPNVRVNFDTGNITYYNQGTDAVTELKKIIDYVATVELKDHNGQYKVWNFPVLGKGVVDFPGVLKVLEEHGFRGPITMEVEGIHGVEMDEAQTKQYIAESVGYIQSLGHFR